MKRFDQFSQRMSRGLARRTSRRSLLSNLGMFLVGGAVLPLLPIARGISAEAADPAADGDAEGTNDPNSCNYWRYCAIDGFLCGCCGGSSSQCPPGTIVSPITWIGTCRNTDDGKNYIISYNDCCGQSICGRCYCHRNEGDTPHYRPSTSNDTQWCAGSSADVAYNCSLAVVVGQAGDN